MQYCIYNLFPTSIWRFEGDAEEGGPPYEYSPAFLICLFRIRDVTWKKGTTQLSKGILNIIFVKAY